VIWVDWAILAIVAVSMVISLFRGLAREVLSLLAWVGAGWVALHYSHDAAAWLEPWVPAPSVRVLLGGGALFAVVLLCLGLLNALVARLIRSTGLTGTDRSLGMLFGLARGVAIVTVMVLAAGVTAIPADPWWEESLLLDHFEDLAVEVRGVLPPTVAGVIRYPDEPPAGASPLLPLAVPGLPGPQAPARPGVIDSARPGAAPPPLP